MAGKNKYLPFLILILLLFITELFIFPIGEFALNDDWAYAKSVYRLNQSGNFFIGLWPAMTLYSHALLGFAFVKIFGFSFTVLRFANMFLCIVTLLHVYKFFCKKNSPGISALVCAFIVFNPFYLNIFNSFMTDLSFFNFSFLAFYYLNNYFLNRKNLHLLIFFLFAVLAILTRQLGIVLFLAFIIVEALNYKRSKKNYWLISLLSFGAALILLYIFENDQLPKFPAGSNYQGIFFSPTKMQLDDHIITSAIKKIFNIIRYSGALLLLILVLLAPALLQRLKSANKYFLSAIAIAFAFYLYVLRDEHALGNIFINIGVGIESTVDMLMIRSSDLHSTSNALFIFLMALFSAGYMLFAFLIGSVNLKSLKQISLSQQFVALVLIGYLCLIGIVETSFDRYSIFFALFVVVFIMSNTISFSKRSVIGSLFCFFVFFLFSVFATKDYFTAAKIKKQIFNELVINDKINPIEINAGFEYQLWDQADGEVDWINWDHYNDKKYVIARGKIENFDVIGSYPYRRFVPFKTDTFFVVKNRNK